MEFIAFNLSWIIILIALFIVLKGAKIVRQAEVVLIERLGKYHRTLQSGLNFIIPFIDTPRGIYTRQIKQMIGGGSYVVTDMSSTIDLRETLMEFPKQNVITKDNVTIGINAVLYFQIVDPKSAVYEVNNLPNSIETITQTSLRNVIGELDLDQTLVSRDAINEKLRIILDEATNKWGIKITRVELQEIVPPKEIQAAMEKQMKAERDRRAQILEAEGLKKAAILEAEGIKEAEINKAEGQKRSEILKAEGEAQAKINIANAEAQAIQMIIEALKGNGDPDKYLIAIKYIETLKGMVTGQNNKVVYMPYEATGVLSSLDSIKQMFDNK